MSSCAIVNAGRLILSDSFVFSIHRCCIQEINLSAWETGKAMIDSKIQDIEPGELSPLSLGPYTCLSIAFIATSSLNYYAFSCIARMHSSGM